MWYLAVIIGGLTVGVLSQINKRHCSVCGKRFSSGEDKAADLQRLKPAGEYEPAYDAYKHLCRLCWAKVTTIQCDLCRASFNACDFRNQRDPLVRNLQEHSIPCDDLSSVRRVCHACSAQRLHCVCGRCGRTFSLASDMVADYKSNADILKWLAPHHKDYRAAIDHLCPTCHEACLAACQDVQTRCTTKWVDGTWREFVAGFRTVEKLGRVDYDGAECDDPLKVKERLQLYAVQLGGNAFVEFFDKRHSNNVIAGHGPRGNEYHKRVQPFTGCAIAVVVEPMSKKHPASTPQADGPITRNVKHLVLDGLNICGWAASGERRFDFRILVTLALELTYKRLPFLVFLDANAPHELKGDPAVAVAYGRLVRDLPQMFKEVPGKTQADEFILQRANSDNSHVVSNDQFRPYAERYPWVLTGDRLIKGTVAAERLQVPQLDIDVPLLLDVAEAADVLVKTIALQSHETRGGGG
jgi:hypothetical protein